MSEKMEWRTRWFRFREKFFYIRHNWDAYLDWYDFSYLECWIGFRCHKFKLGIEWYIETKEETCTCRECKFNRAQTGKLPE